MWNTNLSRRRLGAVALAGVAVAAAAGGAAYALWPSPSSVGDNTAFLAQEGVAIEGHDPVAYFTEANPVKGSAEHAYDWGGVTWHFASAAHRDRFKADPTRFAPQYGGYCAWAMAQGQLAPIDPQAWAIVDGKLYLNYSPGIHAKWEIDIPGHISKADQNWPGLRPES
ncbi:MAG: YHS domain-containing (seleno)protein [Alphaproteobacteria bacterium]|nr:YHS domain-containing (seleno)protein [Alphaproteobacteria bacterium]